MVPVSSRLVTSLEMIDKAHAIARADALPPSAMAASVPGSEADSPSNRGADAHVYSPLDCLKIAKANPTRR